MSVSQLSQVDDSNFDQIVFSEPTPVMVEFFAPWCPHCRKMAPLMEQIAREYAGRLRVVQANAETNRAALLRFGVSGVPTIIIFINGQEAERIIGEVPEETLRARLDQVLATIPQPG